MRWAHTAIHLALAAALSTTTMAHDASARTTVEIGEVSVPDGDAQKKETRRLRSALREAAKEADFGDVKSVTINAEIVEWNVEQNGDVLRVTCTLVGRLEGGKTARSHISYGGRPNERAKLEKAVVVMVARGLMTRLAQLAQR
jgi:hypothetical protein